MPFVEYEVTVTTTGDAGSATGNSNSPTINGAIHAVYVNYHASAPATTTVDLDEVGGAARKILDLAGANTDAGYLPRAQAQGTTGSNLTGIYDRLVLAGRPVKVTVAASDALAAAVIVTLVVEE